MLQSSIFLKTHSGERNQHMIKYFYSTCPKPDTSSEIGTYIQQIPFLMDHKNNLQLVKNIYFPAETIGDTGTTDSKDLFVNKIISDWLNQYSQNEIKQWLQKLEAIKRFGSFTTLPSELIQPVSYFQNRETSSDETSIDTDEIETYVRNPIKQNHSADSSAGKKHQNSIQISAKKINTASSESRRSLSFSLIESNDENIKLIDISSISTSSSKPIKSPFDRIEENGGLNLHTGSNGEQTVYEYLLYKYRHQLDSVSIKWKNQNGEAHLSYDILLIENGKKHYIEIKSTRTHDQHSFQLSINQIKAILQYRENYSIYRIYLEEKKLVILDNI
ncbi:unnamed protein product [Rotaria sp. Silwood2]|nr:unnamed protein product [Rotaria sp. Silwood2]